MKDIIFEYLKRVDLMKTAVGVSFVGIFGFTVVYVLTKAVPDANKEIAHFMMGEVAGCALTIAAYYYGSSKGSQEKSTTIQKQIEKTNP